VTDLISESLSKVVDQFNAAIKDTKDYVKKALEEVAHAPTATGMDTSSDIVQEGASVPAHPSQEKVIVEVVDEYVEREKQKNNLNLPKPAEDLTEQCIQQDAKTVANLVKDEFNLSNIKIQRVARLGSTKSSTSKPRLLLVEFGDVSMKRTILKQATKLRKSSTRSNVYISPDLTPKEHSQNKLLRDELKMQKAAGEKDIYIKRGKIVSRSAGAGTPPVLSN